MTAGFYSLDLASSNKLAHVLFVKGKRVGDCFRGKHRT